jgi:class 3 adenylate cyclase/DNA-binding NarL/FixJ family response regulator
MRELPQGTVTLLFTDVEASTPMVAELGEESEAVLNEHRRLIRTTVETGDGTVINCLGDEAYTAFANPRNAVDAAAEIQRAITGDTQLAAIPLRVRIGVHTGEPTLGDDGYFGLDVHRTARICSAGHGGQVLLSEPTKSAVGDTDGIELRDLGAQWLKGLPRPERLFQLVVPGLRSDFPELRNRAQGLAAAPNGMQVVVADDSMLLREGVVRVLGECGFEVVGQAGSPDELLAEIERANPDVAVVDIRMPPTQTDEGIRAALEIRRTHPDVGVLMLSQFAEPAYALDLLEAGSRSIGYLLKDRVSDMLDFGAAVRRVGEGGSALDPEVVSLLIGRARLAGPLAELSDGEAELAQLVAEGRSAGEIADRLVLDESEAEERIDALLDRLGLADSPPEERGPALLGTLRESARTTG